jgi:hypothetical protein
LQGSFAFGIAEFVFNGNSICFDLSLLFLLFSSHFPGAAQWLAAEADAALFAPGAVDLVSEILPA